MNRELLNKIHLGDCLEIMPLIDDKSIDMIFCDLPYGTTNFDWDVVIPFEPLFKQYLRIIKDNGIILLTAQQPFATDVINACRKYFRYDLVWEKTQKMGFPNANKMPLKAHELILVFYKKLPYYNPIKSQASKDNMSWGRTRKQGENRYNGYQSSMGKATYKSKG
jgi:site-specific DNA-methyltransferase (adenine-specific)